MITSSRRDAAYDRLRQQRPAVILVDLHLDYVAEGWVLLDLLQATPALAQILVIVWSADGSPAASPPHHSIQSPSPCGDLPPPRKTNNLRKPE